MKQGNKRLGDKVHSIGCLIENNTFEQLKPFSTERGLLSIAIRRALDLYTIAISEYGDEFVLDQILGKNLDKYKIVKI